MGVLFQTIRTVFLGVIADFFYFPIWWYTRGLWKQLRGIVGSLEARQDALALDVWIKNIGKPMYGQYDFVGRLISFFMRLVQIIGRMIALIVWGFLLLVWLFVWILIPAAVVYLIVLQFKMLI